MDAQAWRATLVETVDAVSDAVRAIAPGDLGRAGGRAGQYDLDLVAERAALEVLVPTGARVLSEEAGSVGDGDSDVTVVIDPVDGSTNLSRGVPHAACSLCVVDGEGPWVAVVADIVTGERFDAVRGGGARLDGTQIGTASGCARLADAVVCFSGWPTAHLGWRQFRALGAAALDICYVAAGRVDAFVDALAAHGVWDYLGALLVCDEVGVAVAEHAGDELVVLDHDARRGPIVAATPELLAEIQGVLAGAAVR